MGATQRHFLGWSEPLIESACAWIAGRFGSHGGGVDLTGVHIIVPGGRFGRRLLDRLARRSAAVIGEVSTIDAFLERVLPVGNAAPDWVRRVCWMLAEGRLSDEHRRSLWPAEVRGSVTQSLAMVRLIDDLSRRLAGEGVGFADAARAVERQALPDRDRWEALARLESSYRGELAELGVADEWNERSRAAGSPGCLPRTRVVLVGVLEIPGVLGKLLADDAITSDALIAAPPDRAELFDERGAVAAAWQDVPLPIPDHVIRLAEIPDQQAEVALLAAAGAGPWPAMHASDVVIAVPDEEVDASIRRLAGALAAPEDGRTPVRVRPAAGTPATRTAPGRLLELVSDLLTEGQFTQLAALMRHTDAERVIREGALGAAPQLISSQTDLIRILDEYTARFVHGAIDGRWLGAATARNGPMHAILDSVYAGLRDLLGELWEGDRPAGERPLAEWAMPIVRLTRRVFDASADEQGTRACEAIEGVARGFSQLAPVGDRQPAVGPGIALRLLLADLSAAAIPTGQEPGAVELLGWLDAASDPAPAIIFTGMNAGSVPRQSDSDALIPERLRESLGLPTRGSTLARDKCLLMQAISCRDRVLILAGRRSRDGTRRWPSPLLAECDDAKAVDRLRAFLEPESITLPRRAGLASRQLLGPAFELMPLGQGKAVKSIPVTAFKRFLESPYAFYLQSVLELDEIGAEQPELEPRMFGTFVHAVLQRFAQGPARDSTDAGAIEADVLRCLAEVAASELGPMPPTAVAVQVEQASHRLRGFAAWQAGHAAGGWRIVATEWAPGDPVHLDVDGEPIELRGRIDRIDFNARTGELALLDYKTGEDAGDPRLAYNSRSRRWRDLQLPLYRLLAREWIDAKAASGTVLGYITLPKEGQVALVKADWSEEQLAEAVATARHIVGQIRGGRWRERGDHPPEEGAIAALAGVSILLPPSVTRASDRPANPAPGGA